MSIPVRWLARSTKHAAQGRRSLANKIYDGDTRTDAARITAAAWPPVRATSRHELLVGMANHTATVIADCRRLLSTIKRKNRPAGRVTLKAYPRTLTGRECQLSCACRCEPDGPLTAKICQAEASHV